MGDGDGDGDGGCDTYGMKCVGRRSDAIVVLGDSSVR